MKEIILHYYYFLIKKDFLNNKVNMQQLIMTKYHIFNHMINFS